MLSLRCGPPRHAGCSRAVRFARRAQHGSLVPRVRRPHHPRARPLGLRPKPRAAGRRGPARSHRRRRRDRRSISGDAGFAWTSCDDAARGGHTSEPCSFSGGCTVTTGSNECPCDRQAICAAGTLNVQVSCTACVSGMTSHAWTTCDLFRTGGGAPGDACDPATFGACSDGEGCCDHHSCDPSTGTVRFQEPDCASACVPHMDRCPGTSPPGSPTNGLCRSADDCATRPSACLPGGRCPTTAFRASPPGTTATRTPTARRAACARASRAIARA